MVTASLEGTKALGTIDWNYAADCVTIRYAPQLTTPQKLSNVISELGFRVEVLDGPPKMVASKVTKAVRAPLPDDSPQFFRDAFKTARKKEQPVIVDFWAKWCSPCVRLKTETLQDERVASVLDRVQLIYVDLDTNPDLGKAYGVVSVPSVFFIDREGFVVDRLQDFEPPGPFLARVNNLLGDKP